MLERKHWAVVGKTMHLVYLCLPHLAQAWHKRAWTSILTEPVKPIQQMPLQWLLCAGLCPGHWHKTQGPGGLMDKAACPLWADLGSQGAVSEPREQAQVGNVRWSEIL